MLGKVHSVGFTTTTHQVWLFGTKHCIIGEIAICFRMSCETDNQSHAAAHAQLRVEKSRINWLYSDLSRIGLLTKKLSRVNWNFKSNLASRGNHHPEHVTWLWAIAKTGMCMDQITYFLHSNSRHLHHVSFFFPFEITLFAGKTNRLMTRAAKSYGNSVAQKIPIGDVFSLFLWARKRALEMLNSQNANSSEYWSSQLSCGLNAWCMLS